MRLAAHVHSSWSYDGKWPLDRLASAMKARGYDAVLMSEHDRGFDGQKWRDYQNACAEASESGALLVPGMEYSDPSNTVHVLVWGPGVFLGENRETSELLRDIAHLQRPAVLAHPERKNAWQRFRPEWVEILVGMEIWNRKTDGFRLSRAGLRLLYQHELAPWTGLDFHCARQWFPLAMHLGECKRDGAAVIAAVKAGRAKPTAFGINALHFSSGPISYLAHLAEHGRRVARRVVTR